MNPSPSSPASRLGRRSPQRLLSRPAVRPYPACGPDPRDVALAATRALARAVDADTLRQVVATAVGDLGGALVPARFEPADALSIDVSLGLGEPVLVVVDPLSVEAIGLRQVVPELVEDARRALQRLTPPAQQGAATAALDRSTGGSPLERYVGALELADDDAARAVVGGLLSQGADAVTVVDELLVPAQREVGERWYRGQWTTADEHAATGITDRCVSDLPRSEDGPRVLVAVPEGEWHVLATRLVVAAARGTRATALGTGLPAADLRRHLEATQPAALALSCTMPTGLLAAAASIGAAHAAGIPVVAGGRAFGRDGHRAQRVGADAWASAPAALAALVPTLSVDRSSVEVPHEAVLADAVADETLTLALDRHAAAATWVEGIDGRRRAHLRKDLRRLARHAAAALLCDDASIVDEVLAWTWVMHLQRDVPQHVLPDSARYLADSLDAETPRVAELLRRGADRLT